MMTMQLFHKASYSNHCLHYLLPVAKSVNYALRDVGHGLLIDHMLHLNCINGHLLIECYSVIVIECQPTSSCFYYVTCGCSLFIFVFLMF